MRNSSHLPSKGNCHHSIKEFLRKGESFGFPPFFMSTHCVPSPSSSQARKDKQAKRPLDQSACTYGIGLIEYGPWLLATSRLLMRKGPGQPGPFFYGHYRWALGSRPRLTQARKDKQATVNLSFLRQGSFHPELPPWLREINCCLLEARRSRAKK